MSGEFTHFDEKGNAVMVDVSSKDDSIRTALAKASVLMSETCFTALKNGQVTKGDVLGVARVAGIMAAKKHRTLSPCAIL